MFPKWIVDISTKEKPDYYEINGNKAYPELLNELSLSAKKLALLADGETEELYLSELRKLNVDKLTQYWVEVVYQMAKLELRRYLLLSGNSAWPREINIKSDKNLWALNLFPKSFDGNVSDIDVATKGRHALQHYKRLRGFIPN